MAYNYGLLWIHYGLLWRIVACYFGLLGVPGRRGYPMKEPQVKFKRDSDYGYYDKGVAFIAPLGACQSFPGLAWDVA